MIDYIEKHNKIVASRDENGIFHIRVDYMADGDKVKFLIDGDKEFNVSKKLLYRHNGKILYVVSVENMGCIDINKGIKLYSDNQGLFPRYNIFSKDTHGSYVVLPQIKPDKKAKLLFMTWEITDREEVLRLIKDIPNNAIYGHKVLSVFERLHPSLTRDKELFIEGLQYSEHVIKYADKSMQLSCAVM